MSLGFALRFFRGRGCTAAGRSGCSSRKAKKSSHPWHFRCWSLRRNELEWTNLVHWTGALHRFFVTWCNYRCWFCVGKALWRWFYPRSRKRDHFQTLATGVPKLITWLGTERVKRVIHSVHAQPPLPTLTTTRTVCLMIWWKCAERVTFNTFTSQTELSLTHWYDAVVVGCMREWLTMSGTPESSLDTLENKLRTLHLSEGQLRNSLTEPILKAILPGSVGVKLKTCIGEE